MSLNECTILKCEATDVDACWYILTDGHLDAGPPLKAWEARVQQVIEQGARWIIFDTRKIKTYVDLGHGALVKFAGQLRGSGGGAILLAMDERNRNTFRILGIEHFFVFADSMEQALTAAQS